MNKTISINVSGFVFNIEEEAYENLRQYLDNIRGNFSNESERDEIMADVELRIAELFQEKIAPNKEVITSSDILQIQEILGLPEDFASDSDEDYTDERPHTTPEQQPASKRLFRDPDNATLAGVCSGLGYYFDIDRVIFKIIFILLFVLLGSGFLLYIILWIVIPEAKTTSEKIEMKGGAINLETIKEHVSNIKQTITEKGNAAQVREKVRYAVDKSTVVGLSVFQVLSKIFGIGFTIIGIFMFAFLMIILFGNTGILPFIGPDRINGIPELIEIVYCGQNPSILIFLSLILVLTIPIIALITLGVRILFNYRNSIKMVSWTFAIVWTLAASILFGYSTEVATNFKSEKQVSTDFPLDEFAENNLIIDVLDDDQFSNHLNPQNGWDATELIKTDESNIYFGMPHLKISAITDTGKFKVSVIKQSHGKTAQDAVERIERIEYPMISQGNKLFVNPYLSFPRADKLRAQFVQVEIFVPHGKIVKFGKNINRILRYIDNGSISDTQEYGGSEWLSLGHKMYREGSANYLYYEYTDKEDRQIDEQSEEE